MKKGIMVYVFFFILGLVCIVGAADNVVITLVIMLGLIATVLLLASMNKTFKIMFLKSFNYFLDNNDRIFYTVALITFALFVSALWYGPGEPVYITAIRSVFFDDTGKNVIYTEKVQRAVNKQLMRGQDMTDRQVNYLKSQLAAYKHCPKQTVREKIDPSSLSKDEKDNKGFATKEAYVERLNNSLDYNCFASDLEIERFKKEIKEMNIKSVVKESTEPKQGDNIIKPESHRTWFFFKAFLLYFFILCPLSFIVSFSDNVANGLESLLRRAKSVAKGNKGLIVQIFNIAIIVSVVQMVVSAIRMRKKSKVK